MFLWLIEIEVIQMPQIHNTLTLFVTQQNSLMKAIYIVSVLVLFLNYPSSGQDEPAYMNKSWKDLTTQIQRRNDVATVLLIRLKETNKLDSAILQRTKGMVQEFTIYLREKITRFDSSTVRHVFEMNQAVSSNMGGSLILLENQPGIRQINGIMSLLQHLEGAEKRLYTIIQQYNALASEHRRLDLAFSKK